MLWEVQSKFSFERMRIESNDLIRKPLTESGLIILTRGSLNENKAKTSSRHDISGSGDNQTRNQEWSSIKSESISMPSGELHLNLRFATSLPPCIAQLSRYFAIDFGAGLLLTMGILLRLLLDSAQGFAGRRIGLIEMFRLPMLKTVLGVSNLTNFSLLLSTLAMLRAAFKRCWAS